MMKSSKCGGVMGRRGHTVLAEGVAQVVHRIFQGALAGGPRLRCKAQRRQHRQPAVAHLPAHATRTRMLCAWVWRRTPPRLTP